MRMKTWENKLYLDAMPGRKREERPQRDFDLWLREVPANKIETVVCLAPEEQIAAGSPEYAEWRRRQRNELEGQGASVRSRFSWCRPDGHVGRCRSYAAGIRVRGSFGRDQRGWGASGSAGAAGVLEAKVCPGEVEV